MAANKPIAVASSASAMPGATTASEVFLDAAIDRNAVMIPQTVPNRPTNGPAEATVARNSRFDSSRSTSRAIDTSSTFSRRACRPMNEEAALWNERFHSRIADTNRLATPVLLCVESWPYSSSSDWPDQNTCSKRSIDPLNLANSRVLLTMIVQHQNEESNSPTITNLTTIWADQNIDSSVVSGLAAACAAASAGF